VKTNEEVPLFIQLVPEHGNNLVTHSHLLILLPKWALLSENICTTWFLHGLKERIFQCWLKPRSFYNDLNRKICRQIVTHDIALSPNRHAWYHHHGRPQKVFQGGKRQHFATPCHVADDAI